MWGPLTTFKLNIDIIIVFCFKDKVDDLKYP